MPFLFNAPIWVYPQPIGFRKQTDDLVLLIANHLQLNPTPVQLFLFRNLTSKYNYYTGNTMDFGCFTND